MVGQYAVTQCAERRREVAAATAAAAGKEKEKEKEEAGECRRAKGREGAVPPGTGKPIAWRKNTCVPDTGSAGYSACHSMCSAVSWQLTVSVAAFRNALL